MTTDTVTLADDVLLYVFEFYLAEASEPEAWHTLVHVCKQWRTLVFGSPRLLNLRIACTNSTQVGEKLDVWPALPIVISGPCDSQTSLANITAALEHRDRVCQIDLPFMGELQILENVLEVLEEQFPELTVLKLHSAQAEGVEIPDPIFPYSGQYLGGTTHLRSLSLTRIPIPLPNLLLSSTDLVDLRLMEIPISVFVSPDKMVTALSALSKLQVLHLGPEFDEFHPDWEDRCLPLPTRTVLPSLIELRFEGLTEYLDDLMARIDAPLLNRLDMKIVISFNFNLDIVLRVNALQILRFISHVPKFQALDEAHIGIDVAKYKTWIKFLSTRTSSDVLNVEILCIEPERQFPLLAQFCHSPFFPLPTLKSLYIGGGTYSGKRRLDHMENARWLELLQPFTSVKNLYLFGDTKRRIAPALEELGEERGRELLPTLEYVFVEKLKLYEPVAFVSRHRSGHPVVVSDWDRSIR